jgi:tRNA-dihydrouridine synthase B
MNRSNNIKLDNFNINSIVMAAPLAGVTDVIFRRILREFNNYSLVVTEMISSEAIQQRKPQRILATSDNDSPIAFQLSGHKPELMLKGAQKLYELADIIDINMGCPTPKIVKNGDGAALMKTPKLAAELVRLIVNNIDKPVTVKFRLGWDAQSINCIDFARLMQDCGAKMITVHGRTRAQFYAGKADWDKIAEVKKAVSIPVIANGDVCSPETALDCLTKTGCDGVAIGRGLLGDPWLLQRVDHYFKTGEILPEPSIIDRLDMALYHCKELVNFLGEHHGVCHSRKFFGWYIKFIPGAPRYRAMLNQQETFADVQAIIADIISKIPEEKRSRNYKSFWFAC